MYLAETHASHGLYEAADSFFSFLSSVFPVGTPNSSEWLRAKHRVDFARAVGEADLEKAAKAQSSLAALDETEGRKKFSSSHCVEEKKVVTDGRTDLYNRVIGCSEIDCKIW